MKIDPQTGKVRADGWAQGVDNRSDDHDIAETRVRDAVNVDILTSGKVRSRLGIQSKIASPGAHSAFANSSYMVWATDNGLYVSEDGITGTLVLSHPALYKPISYVEVNSEIYWSNEDINGKINTSGQYEKWGIDTPEGTLILLGSDVVAPALPRLYQVTYTYVLATGEESGSGPVTQVTCGDFPSIAVYDIPQPVDSRVIAVRMYMTNIDGAVFYAVKDVPIGITTTVLQGFSANGAQLKTLFGMPPPPGQLLDYANGKIYIASGKVVFVTEPLRYGIVDINKNYFMWSERVTLVKAVTDGFFVSADKTYFVSQTAPGIEGVRQVELFAHKAVEGAACSIPNTKDVIWFSEQGFVKGKSGGNAELLTEGQIAVKKYASGSMGYSYINGHKAVVAMLQGGVENEEINSDYTAAEASRISELV